MKIFSALAIAFLLAAQPCVALAETAAEISGPDTRLYLEDGSVVMGRLIEKSDDLIIMEVERQIHTFEPTQVEKIVTLESLGARARTITITEFPYISFLGGTVAFGVLSGLLFDRASDKDKEADQNAQFQDTIPRAIKLRDDADMARLLGWGSALLAAGTLGVALIPHKTTRRVFPELSMDDGAPTLKLSYVHRF